MYEITGQISGYVGADPELRFTPSGDAVVNLLVAVTPRFMDRATSQWKDGDTQWVKCTGWRKVAEHVAESMPKGTRVMITGRFNNPDTWIQTNQETGEQTAQARLNLTIDEIGVSVKDHPARSLRTTRTAS